MNCRHRSHIGFTFASKVGFLLLSAAILLAACGGGGGGGVADSKPSITVSPTDQTVNAPSPATFSVTATGQPAPVYQWQFSSDGGSNWSNVSTGSGWTTATYTTAATSATDDGTLFRVRLTNGVGDPVTSNTVTLTVNYVPAPTSSFAKVLSTPTATYGNRIFGSANGKYLVASAEGSGTSVSTDFGETWTARPALGTALALVSGYVADDGSLMLGAGANESANIYRSTDGFATFGTATAVTAGNVGFLWKPYGLASTVFVGNYNVIPTTIYKSTDNGLTFSLFSTNTNTAWAYSISGSDDGSTMLVTGADWGDCASFSTNGGVSWSKAGALNMHGMTGSTSADGTKMFVPWGYSLTSATVSTNGGANWSETTGATGLSWASGANSDLSAIYEITYNSNMVYKSTDFGLTFSLFDTISAMAGAPFSGPQQNYGLFVSRNGKVVVIGGTDGVYLRYF